jgi:hypothetical protein
MGVQNQVLGRESEITGGIELLRQTLAFSVFDVNKCASGIKALESYAYEWDEDKSRFKNKPRHDWTSHASDAARYAARAASRIKNTLTEEPKSDYRETYYSSNSWMG